jgi:isoamyl acetate esterase
MANNTILLIGDSLTEQGYVNHWCSMLQNSYQRRADVICRGFSGYNTRWVLRMLNSSSDCCKIIPEVPPLFCVVFLGANDAVSASYPQHVPIDEFEDNLRSIARLLLEKAKPLHGVVIVSPPPIDEAGYLEYVQRERDASATVSSRTFENTRCYRDAALRVAAETVSCIGVDLYAAFLGPAMHAPFAPEQEWATCFFDGLHFDSNGGKIVFDALMAALPLEVLPQSIPMSVPHWSTLT